MSIAPVILAPAAVERRMRLADQLDRTSARHWHDCRYSRSMRCYRAAADVADRGWRS